MQSMKTILISIVFYCFYFTVFAQAAEIVDVRNQIPMTNDAPRIKDYYLSTDGASLKKDLVVKIVRNINVSQAKKNIGDVKVEIGQLRIMAVADKVAVAREYKLFSKDQVPLTESIGFMVGDQVDTTGSFTDNSKRKPNGEEAAHAEPTVPAHEESATPAPNEAQVIPAVPVPEIAPIVPEREPSSEQLITPDAHADSQKIEVKIFPDKI